MNPPASAACWNAFSAALVKIISSGVCIGTGGSMGREGPIVQIGAALGSMSGQFFRLSTRNVIILVAAGGAAGISATFHAPLAGVVFACEIILGSFAVETKFGDQRRLVGLLLRSDVMERYREEMLRR